ncbi:ABC transporter permease [Paraburkholderia hospita]|uniref:ABC transporter permease n=1 Tax=Paraburkholderia hospita TaxID=169430 RepID=A0AAN1JJF2_9BURK|nr:ABC transporter permease [Paraburkholderia hospita]AUT74835.1 ABC transporter permease [Paraburkholderia hospita]EIM95031.1 binding-protein-dependent transport system inner membrane protein [Paraburkholderia hospita]OUL80035.1 ABC transporter permease [Paraburkholderia hospita]OUL91852.1 ABC transporter permease [Paraburkholderia hospita]SEH68593.1 putative spermidine/putrescine transport system permease protein [Paraburkholderia hospita]
MPVSAQAAASGSPTRANGRASFQKAQRRASAQALLLALPLILFLLSTFIAPIALLLARSVQNHEVPNSMPALTRALDAWDGRGVPDERTFALLASGLKEAQGSGQLGTVARRLNFAQAEFRSLLMRTARNLPADAPPAWKPALVAMDERWNSPETWRLLKRAAASPTPDYLLAAVDAQVTPQGSVEFVPDNSSVYRQAFLRTISISATVTVLCLLLGYPVAWMLANLPAKSSNSLMLLVIVPFWTSLLVRTTAWYVLLQPGGVINSLLMGLGLATHPVPLIFNRAGVLIGMTHVLLPYMILAIYSVMKSVSPIYVRAAQSLGAHPFTAFVRVYVPQTLPGVGAGCFLVFVLALGYYITPALLGGAGDEMISQLIAMQTNTQLNWGLAGALSAYLVIFTAVFYFLFNRIVGIDRLRFG